MIPLDLITIREAEARTQVPVATIRSWVNQGIDGRKLPSYRQPNEAEVMLVSEAGVRSMHAHSLRRPRKKRGPSGPGKAAHIILNQEDTVRIYACCAARSQRLGIKISLADFVRMLVREEERRTEVPAKKWTPELTPADGCGTIPRV